MIGVDTNVLVYAIDSRDPRHEPCRRLLRGVDPARSEQLALPWAVVYEFLRVATHPGVLPNPISMDEAWGVIMRLSRSERALVIGPGPTHPAAAWTMLGATGIRGNLVHDAHIAAVLSEHGVRRIYTFDNDMRRFPGLEVLDPLT